MNQLTKEDVQQISQLYKGFFIENPVGNNAFSYTDRKQNKIYVPSLVEGDLNQLVVSSSICFSEISDGKEFNVSGLQQFIYYRYRDKNIFIFDNHNHAFFFWAYGFLYNYLKAPIDLVHVDQHTDMREPSKYFLEKDFYKENIEKIFEYTNFDLNVGSFIKPAQRLGILAEVVQINSQESFNKFFKNDYILDIDMDIFAKDMNYIPKQFKLDKIKDMIEKSSWITIATSPYFIDQHQAIDLIKKLLI